MERLGSGSASKHFTKAGNLLIGQEPLALPALVGPDEGLPGNPARLRSTFQAAWCADAIGNLPQQYHHITKGGMVNADVGSSISQRT